MSCRTQKDKSQVLYHIGKRKPSPHEMHQCQRYLHDGHPSVDKAGVWLSPNPKLIFLKQFLCEIEGALYSFRVPIETIKRAGGIQIVDGAPEIFITEELWHEVEFIGKVTDNFKPVLSNKERQLWDWNINEDPSPKSNRGSLSEERDDGKYSCLASDRDEFARILSDGREPSPNRPPSE